MSKKLVITVQLELDDAADIEELKQDFNSGEVDYLFKHDYIISSYVPYLAPIAPKEAF